MKIRLNQFKGIRPRVSDHLLEQPEAKLALDAFLDTGDVRGWRKPKITATLATTGNKSLFQYKHGASTEWVKSANDLDWVGSPIVDDTFERQYFTGEALPRQFANDIISTPWDATTDFEKMGVLTPAAAPTFTSGSTGGSLYRGYVYTYVSRYGEEGPPSPVLATSAYLSGSVVIGGFTDPGVTWGKLTTATGAGDVNMPMIRLYRTASTTAGVGAFQFVKEVDVDGITWATFEITDDVVTLGEVLPSENWVAPPSGLKGLVDLPTGVLVGFSGKDVYFTEPYLPHAWNPDYAISFAETIIGLGIIGSSVLVLTNENGYLIYGNHPSVMSKQRFAGVYPCASKRSIVSTEWGVIFASRIGIILCDQNGFKNLTEVHMLPQDMDNYFPSTWCGEYYDGRYYGFFYDTTSKATGCLTLSIKNGILSTLKDRVLATFVSPADAKYYIIQTESTGTTVECIKEWEGSLYDFLQYSWKSKRFVLSETLNFSVARVIVDVDYYSIVVAEMDNRDYLQTLNTAAWSLPLLGCINEYAFNDQDIGGDTLFTLYDMNLNSVVSFQLFVDGVLRFTRLCNNDDIFRLPGGYRGKQVEIALTGFIPIKDVVIGQSVREVME